MKGTQTKVRLLKSNPIQLCKKGKKTKRYRKKLPRLSVPLIISRYDDKFEFWAFYRPKQLHSSTLQLNVTYRMPLLTTDFDTFAIDAQFQKGLPVYERRVPLNRFYRKPTEIVPISIGLRNHIQHHHQRSICTSRRRRSFVNLISQFVSFHPCPHQVLSSNPGNKSNISTNNTRCSTNLLKIIQTIDSPYLLRRNQ